jgi:threonine synthase
VPPFLGYRCSLCGSEYPPQADLFTCPRDHGNLDVRIDLASVRKGVSPAKFGDASEPSLWRYLPLLPVDDPGLAGTPLRSAGWTPLFQARRMAQDLGLKSLWIKDDGRNPTASFKDRASAVVVARARQVGAEPVITASTGNAGAALAGMAAAAGLPAIILAPRSAPPAKVAQLLMFGAKVLLVEGSYDDAFDLSLAAAREFGWYCRNTGYNPFTAEGKKTAALEIAEQWTALQGNAGRDMWDVPQAVFVSVGDGNIISGMHRGFRDLRELGWIEHVPRLYGVQAEGSDAIARAFRSGSEEIRPVKADTLADSISVDLPRDGVRALRAARQTGGEYVVVSDEAILEAMVGLARGAAVFAEPAGAAAYAGLVEVTRRGGSGLEEVVVLVTGSGLKDVRAALRAAGEATVIPPTLEALRRAA